MNLGKMMKEMQKMQGKLQEQIEALDLEGSAGGGMVTVRMNGKKEVTALKIDPEAISPDDPELMEDLILAAINDAGRKVDDDIQELTQGLAGGLNIPGLS